MTEVVLVDIDGTLTVRTFGAEGRRGPYDWDRVGEDDPNWPVIDLVADLRRCGYLVTFVSGRDEQCRDATWRWLIDHGAAQVGDELLMRPRKDNRLDEEIKAEIYERQIAPYRPVKYVIDDRDKVVAMWRSLGLTVLQVADGDF